ncbi:tetratricopeptide repeat protein [Paractinoplanes atraurantiacus]|uniref:NACHT domain-containing protein n=1 Tax=Paractinoplanes atraurantiacus TaxID=1036182 RepID=A0A285HFL8_9ACTN|nr:NACHT domain-containing protein [Actinoplanes atraurantiacus]SNY34383.1 NACHT domain-containing protein [Actinoplanes atraurantiacus]
MSGRLWRGLSSGLIVAGLAVAASWASIADHKVGLTVVTAAIAAVAGAFAPTLVGLLWSRGDPHADVAELADRLAVRMLTLTRVSSLRARLHRPMPLRVRFRTVGGAGATRPAVTGEPGQSWQAAPLTGHVGEIASVLRDLPWRQLVVIGERGAGKTVLAMMLVDQLLDNRPDGDPVPILLSVSSWNPATESVADFVARRIAEDFGVDREAARQLAHDPRASGRWWVMPVLDGLDEIDAALYTRALERVEAFAAADRPVVLTCRLREYLWAESQAGALARAAVVKMEPLEVDEVTEFLADPSETRERLWAPVFAEMRERPTGVLATTLASPLMAGLAKDTFRLGDPGVLVGLTTHLDIEQRLIDGYVDIVYRGQSRRAARWLSSLSYLGYLGDTRDLCWWQLRWPELAVQPQRLRSLLTFFTTVVAGVAGFVLARHVWGLFAGAFLVVSASGPLRRVFAHDFQPAPPGDRWRVGHVLYGLAGGLLTGLISGGLVRGALAGLACAALSLIAPVPGSRSTGGPRGTLAANHLTAAMLALRLAAIAAAVFGLAGLGSTAGPVRWAGAGLAVFGLTALAGAEHTWLRFRVYQLLFAVRTGRAPAALPVRLIAFLTDGTDPDRATLRVNGTAWQFRHANIQDHLLRTTQIDLLRRRARSGVLEATENTFQLLREQGLHDEAIMVLARLGAGAQWTRHRVADLLREMGDAAELRRRAVGGDGYARQQLVRLLRDRGDEAEAITVLRSLAAAGDDFAERQLAELLIDQGDTEAAKEILTRRADLGDGDAQLRLKGMSRPRGEQPAPPVVLPEWVVEVEHRSHEEDYDERKQLLVSLRKQGNEPELRRLSAKGDDFALEQLVQLLQDRGDLDAAVDLLRHDKRLGIYGFRWLLELLRARGSVDELRRLAAGGDTYARDQLVGLFRDRGNLDEAVAVLRRPADSGDSWAGRELVRLLTELGRFDEAIAFLQRRDAAGDFYARYQLQVVRRRREAAG